VIDSADLRRNLERVRAGIAAAAARAGRDPAEVSIVAVSKGQPAAAIRFAAQAGVTDVGENYVNELATKRDELGGGGVRWHYVGALQSSTAHRVADLAEVVHSVGSMHAAERLGARAQRHGRRIQALIQVDFPGGRNGVAPDEVGDAVGRLRGLPGIELAGLMTLPPNAPDPEDARPYFRRLRELRDRAGDARDLRELSMGMSGDYEVAVEEGATMVRIGTALFGPRPTE
jgi:pyridoxal phosphate enzyme (YggS family)